MSSYTSIAKSIQNAGEPPIRSATLNDISALATLLGRSLEDDPLCRWKFPNAKQRINAVARDYARLLKPHIKNGIVATIEFKSVAVWTPPNPPEQTLWERYQESFHMRYTHGRRVHQVRDCLEKMARRHPLSPHWYLLGLATDDDCRGQGMASRLLEDMLCRCDTEGQQVALETSKESNLAFYERFGFVVEDELLVDESVTTWLMIR